MTTFTGMLLRWDGDGGGGLLRAILCETLLTMTVWKKGGGVGKRDKTLMMAVGMRARP